MERIRFIQHSGQRVLLVDFRNCTSEEVTNLTSQVRQVVGQEPKGSVLALADFSGAQFSREAVTRIKEVTAMDRPFVKRAAWVGTENLPKVFYDAIRTFSVREFPVFKTREAALDYLTQESAADMQDSA
ncbi:MAG TPA: hypothetical protein VE994_04065 [Terriglobales bacterium]|nr:hypothetical protein [Terriglobales bacterium]